jgi:hypothetical protein
MCYVEIHAMIPVQLPLGSLPPLFQLTSCTPTNLIYILIFFLQVLWVNLSYTDSIYSTYQISYAFSFA